MIVELRDEACTQWAPGWLAFQRRDSRAFSDLEFNIHLSDDEVKESTSKAEVDGGAEVLSGAPDRAPLLIDLWVLLEANSSASPTGVPPFDSSTSASRGRTSSAEAFYFNLAISWHGARDFCTAYDLGFSSIHKDSPINFIAHFIVLSI